MKEIDNAVVIQCDTLVTCNICKDKFFSIDESGKTKIPKVLECQHSFCDLCLKGYIRSGGLLTSVFPCPTCRKSNLWPLNGIDGFPTDRKAKLIIELMDNLKKDANFSEEGPLCKVCSSNKVDRKADYFCMEDMQMLCKVCFERHRDSEVLGHHKFIELVTGNIIQDNPSNKPLCKLHHLMLSYTCTTCNQHLCQCCLYSHKNHQFILNDSHDKSRSSLKDFSKFKQDIDAAKGRLESVIAAEKVLANDLEKAKEEIEQAYKEAQLELEKTRVTLLQGVKDKKVDLNNLVAFKKKLAVKVKEAEKLIEKDPYEKKKEKAENQLRALGESLHEEGPEVKRLVFRRGVVARMGELTDEDFQFSENCADISSSSLSISSGHSSEVSPVTMTERLKDAMIDTLKFNTIMRKDQGHCSRMFEDIKATEKSLWRVHAKCKSCSFACKGRLLVMIDSSERDVFKQVKLLRSSDGGQTKVAFELAGDLINHFIALNVDKSNVYLLCSSTSQHTLLKKFKLDLASKQLSDNAKETTIKCLETTKLDLLEGNLIDPISFCIKKNTLAVLCNRGSSLHLFNTKFKLLSKLASTEFGRSNYVELDEKGNVYVSDVEKGEIRVVFDREGQIKCNFSFTGQGGLQMAPQGLRVDDKGCILVADQAIGAVSLYDCNNRLLDHVVENLESPLALAYSSEHHVLAVSDHESLRAYLI